MTETTLLATATQLMTSTRLGSPSMLMRRIGQDHGVRITFTTAVDLLDQMEAAGIVGPADGSKARDVLMEPEQAATALASRRPEAAILRQAADRLLAHPGPHTDALQPDAPGFWWDTRDRDAAAVLLLQWADEIHPA